MMVLSASEPKVAHYVNRLEAAVATLVSQRQFSYSKILPIMFSIRGQPYSLENHFPLEPYFHSHIPLETIFLCGRQVGKSAALGTKHLAVAGTRPHTSVLFLTPLFEQARRFSANYVRKFIEESAVRGIFVDSSCEKNILQRTLKNGSILYFSFAQTSGDRTRGLPIDMISWDEIQDASTEVVDVTEYTASASTMKVKTRSGTPKSTVNTANGYWKRSSMSEWVTKCRACNHWNIPTLDHDFIKMLGPWREDISAKSPGVICAKCERPIDPRGDGRWLHAYPDRAAKNLGLHIPQIILPMHYASADAWAVILGKYQNAPLATFLNEIGGIAYDVGVTLISEEELRAASQLGPNTLEQLRKMKSKYARRVVAIDWGGGGAQGVSRTAIAALGMRPNGTIDVVFGFKSKGGVSDHMAEVSLVAKVVEAFQAEHIAHDFNGAGAVRETLLVQAGFPVDRLLPMVYGASGASGIMVHRPPTDLQPRHWYQVDKARSLSTTCEQIRLGALRFFDFDYVSNENPGLIRDFLYLQVESYSRNIGRDAYFVNTEEGMSDDFAQAVNMGCCAIWHISRRWPQMAAQHKFRLSPTELARLSGRLTTHQFASSGDPDLALDARDWN